MTTTTDDGWTGRALLPHEASQLGAVASAAGAWIGESTGLLAEHTSVTLQCGSVVRMGDDGVPLVVVEAESSDSGGAGAMAG